jgi:hypothetical protein
MSDNIVQQDILLNAIWGYRKVISELLYKIYGKLQTNDECKTIFGESESIVTLLQDDYDYSYIGCGPILNDAIKYKKYISEIMSRLKNAGDHCCNTIYNECLNSYIYQCYYLEDAI